jgi:thiol-disulfide isomerase/thioredoxin
LTRLGFGLRALGVAASLGGLLGAAPMRGAIPTVTPAQYRQRVVDPHHGRVLAVNFWATWCVPCRDEMPDLIAVGRKLSGSGVDVALVSADFTSAIPTVERFLRRLAAPFPSFLEQSADPQTFIDAVDPKWGGELPHTAVYSRDGTLRLSLASRQSAAGFEKAFRQVLRER